VCSPAQRDHNDLTSATKMWVAFVNETELYVSQHELTTAMQYLKISELKL